MSNHNSSKWFVLKQSCFILISYKVQNSLPLMILSGFIFRRDGQKGVAILNENSSCMRAFYMNPNLGFKIRMKLHHKNIHMQ